MGYRTALLGRIAVSGRGGRTQELEHTIGSHAIGPRSSYLKRYASGCRGRTKEVVDCLAN